MRIVRWVLNSFTNLADLVLGIRGRAFIPVLVVGTLSLGLVAVADAGDEWPVFSHDRANSNFNPDESKITRFNARYLRSVWETFNDDALVPGPPPTGFVLEGALGLMYPNTVVGVVGSPIVRDGNIYYVDALGTVFARNAATGAVLDPVEHLTTSLVDPDFANGDPPLAPELFYTAPIVTDDHIWLVGSFYGRLQDRKSVV